MPVFAQAEYRRRLEATYDRMDEAELECLIVASPEHIRYLSGYDLWSHQNPQVVLVFSGADEPVWFGRQLDEAGARKTTWLSDQNVRSYRNIRRQMSAYVTGEMAHPLADAAEIVAERGFDDGTIGVEKAAHYFHVSSYEAFREGLPDATFADASLLVRRVRAVKSDQEIEYMRKAADLTAAGMRAAVDTVGEGVPEATAAAAIYEAMVSGPDEFGGDYPSVPPLMPAGAVNGIPHVTWSSDGQYAAGDPVSIEISGSKHGYHAPMSRTLSIGDAPVEASEHAAVIREGRDLLLDVVEPGITCDEAVRRWIEAAPVDVPSDAKLGYSVGLGVSPAWTEDGGPALRAGDATVLEPNMTFHTFPTYTADLDIAVEISDTIRVTEDGAESLTEFPRELIEV